MPTDEELLGMYVDRVVDREETSALSNQAFEVGKQLHVLVDRTKDLMELRHAKGKRLGRDSREILEWICDGEYKLGRLIEMARGSTDKDQL